MVNNVYTTIAINIPSFVSSLKTAVIGKYGSGIEILFESSTVLVFKCPEVSAKIIRFAIDPITPYINISFGDGLVTGGGLINERKLVTHVSAYYAWTACHVVLGNRFMLFNMLMSDSNAKSLVVLIANTVGNNELHMAVIGVVNSYLRTYVFLNSKSTIIRMVTPFKGYNGSNNYLYKRPISIIQHDNSLLTDGFGNIDTIEGLYISSKETTNDSVFKGENYLITSSPMLDTGSYISSWNTGLLAEW